MSQVHVPGSESVVGCEPGQPIGEGANVPSPRAWHAGCLQVADEEGGMTADPPRFSFRFVSFRSVAFAPLCLCSSRCLTPPRKSMHDAVEKIQRLERRRPLV